MKVIKFSVIIKIGSRNFPKTIINVAKDIGYKTIQKTYITQV